MNYSRSELDKLIDEWIIGRNAERNRQIVRRRLFDGITYERLAEEFDLSVRQVKNIVYRCEDTIFRRQLSFSFCSPFSIGVVLRHRPFSFARKMHFTFISNNPLFT